MPVTGLTINSPRAIAVDGNGNLFIADSYNDRILKVTASGLVSVVAGSVITGSCPVQQQYNGQNARSVALGPPGDIAVDANGNLQLGITEAEVTASDGSAELALTVSFTAPSGQIGTLTAPLIGLVPVVSPTGGAAGTRSM